MKPTKSKFFFFLSLVILLGSPINSYAQNKSKSTNIAVIEIRTSAVCNMCKDIIEKTLAYESGVKKATLDVKTKICTVQYDIRKTTPEKIRSAISKSGYDADDILADQKAYDKLDPCCKKDAVPH